ncbi:outer membrane protein assembly factor BamE domain-containing protein [Methylobacillus rhizosphaerae]|nr:outer membrane protein assembly factor BamE [Methylobacillus rhizosphaerae]
MRHIILSAALLCVACSSALPSFKPYRMDIQQGNIVTSKMMLQLRPGMTRSQVRFIMGTPLIQDSFHRDRWDYVYQMRKGGKVIEQRRVIMEFEGDSLKRVRGDVIPASPEDTAMDAQQTAPAAVVIEPRAPEEKGMLERLKFWKSDEEKAETEGAEYYDAKRATEIVTEDPKAPRKVVPELITSETRPAAVPVEPSEPQVSPAEPQLSPEPSEPAASPALPEPEPEPSPVSPEPVVTPSAPETQEAPAKPAAAAPKSNASADAATSQPDAGDDDDDLPREDEPGYFERMLEKIGF